MLTRRLGASGLAVSRLALGTMAWGTRTEPEDDATRGSSAMVWVSILAPGPAATAAGTLSGTLGTAFGMGMGGRA